MTDSPRFKILRFVAQWVLPLVAVVMMFQILRGNTLEIRSIGQMFIFDFCLGDSSIDKGQMYGWHNFTPDQQLILQGDRTQSSAIEREKAIWEKWPTNIVYLHNYMSYYASLAPHRGEEVKTNKEWRVDFAQDIVKLQAQDPDNARFDYILAGNLLAEAIKDEYSKTNANGTTTNKWGMKVLDRAKLDQAMAYFKIGLGKPKYRRYASEMAAEKLAIMGEPTTLLQGISEIGVIAGMPFPDLVLWRQLGRTSMAYTSLLIEEGRTNDAREILSACRKFVPQINNDVYTLIDVLVVGAVAGIVSEQIPADYLRLGDAATAQQAGIETIALARPIKDWKQRHKELSKDSAEEISTKRHSGILANLLMPGLGEYPTVKDLTPSRMVEYVVVERSALGGLSISLLIMMFFCIVLSLTYHFANKTGMRTVYICHRIADWGRLILVGGVLPLLSYYIVTRWSLWTCRSLSPAIEYPQMVAQFIALLLVIVVSIYGVTNQLVRQGCVDRGIQVAPETPSLWRRWVWLLVGMLWLLAVLPETWLTDEDLPGHAWTKYLPSIIGVVLSLSALAYLGYGIVRRDWFRKTYAAFYGSFARTLVPNIALALIVMNIIAQPCLRREERIWITKDTVMHIDPKGGFTAIESRIVQRLKAEIQQAAARFPEANISPVK